MNKLFCKKSLLVLDEEIRDRGGGQEEAESRDGQDEQGQLVHWSNGQSG